MRWREVSIALVCVSVLVTNAFAQNGGLVLTQGRLFASSGEYMHQSVSIENKTTQTFERVEVECGFYSDNQLVTADRSYVRNLGPGSLGHTDVVADHAKGANNSKCRIVRSD